MSSFLTQGVLVFSTLLLPLWACTQTHSPWDDWSKPRLPWGKGFRDSLDLERGQLHIFPDSSGFFYFRVDTSLGDLRSEMHRFFHFGPSERGFFPPAFREFDRMFEQFFRSMPQSPFQQPWHDFPADDGQMNEEDNSLPEERLRQKEMPEENNRRLLPEERLRLEERKNAPNKKKPTEPGRQAPDVKTIRI